MTDLEQINVLVGEKKFTQAQELINKALETDLDNVELLKLSGLVEVNLGDWMTARSRFESVVKYQPDDATSWFYLANCYNQLGDFISAKNAYVKVIDLRKDYIEAYKSLCVVLLKLEEYPEAVNFAAKAMKLDNSDYMYDFVIGSAFMKLKDYKRAIEPLLSALNKTIDSQSFIIYSLGTCYMAMGETQNALKMYEKAIEISPSDPMAYYNLGSALQIQNNHEAACEYFQKAIDLEEDETFINSLAISEVKLKRFNQALEHYKQLAVMCPDKANYKFNVIICYEALGDIQTAIKLLEELVYINPKFILPAQKLASLYMQTHQLIKAKEIYDNILLKNKVTAETMHQYAVLSSNLCDTATAEKMLKKVIKMNPDFAAAHKDLGTIYLNQRLFDYAEEEFKTALSLAPNEFDILFEYGNYLYSISKNAEAEEYYKKSLDIEPENVLALTFMGLNELVMNKLDSAKEFIMKAIKKEPHHEYVQFCTGRILYARGEYEDAKMYLIKAVEQNPDVETQNTLALTYFALKDYHQALNIFKNIYEKCPQSVSVLMDIARCYAAIDDKDSALSYLDKVIEIFPDDEEAHAMIRKLS